MSVRVLLISLNHCVSPDPVFPIGLAYINAALRRAGCTTMWYDCNVNRAGLDAVLEDFKPDFVGISVRNIDDVLIRKREQFICGLAATCEQIRAKNPCPIILGGSGFSIFPRQLLSQSKADYGICGEAETSLVALIEALKKGTAWNAIPGLVWRNESGIVVNPNVFTSFGEEIDAMDRPDDVVRYYLQNSGMMNVQTQRGCAQNCCYCTYPLVEGRRHRRRPPEYVAEELEQLHRQGVRYVVFVDSVFNSSEQHIVETCEAILRRNVSMRWSCFLRPVGLTSAHMKLMARAGLSHIEFGSDSFCDSVLEAGGKRLLFENIYESSELACNEDINYCHFLIAGGPGETYETLDMGFQNSLRLRNATIMAVVGMRIYPGTPLMRRAIQEGIIPAEDDLLSPAYYLSPGLAEEKVFKQLHGYASQSPSWIVGNPNPGYLQLTAKLRQRGVLGPLWSYFPIVQRLFPQNMQPEVSA